MAIIDTYYHDLVNDVKIYGDKYEDPNRKGVNRIENSGFAFRHSFYDGFPAITTKKLAWKSVVAETLWILRGQTHIKHLHKDNCHIWDKDAKNYGKGGELGRVYGYQLRNFGGKFDQLKWIIDEMRNNPLSTKKDVTYLNPNDKEHQALTCCHTGWSVIVHKDLSGFDLKFNMGSSDVFHGLPFNIASYGLIAKILESVTGLKALSLIPDLTNVHIYEPHLEAINKQLENSVHEYGACELETSLVFKKLTKMFNEEFLTLDEYLSELKVEDFTLKGYESFPQIKAEMLPYNK